MREELLQYYEQELTYLRQMGAEFGRKYPGVASRLLLEPDGCVDPHVERLLEGFAFLAARVHRRIDDDFPELSGSLLELIHPAYLRPVPSMTIVECRPDPQQGNKTAGTRVPRGTELVSRNTVDQQACRFRTSYDVDLWPFEVVEGEWRQPERLRRPARSSNGEQAVAALRILLRCTGDASFQGLAFSTLRFHIAGEPAVVYPLYELLGENCIEGQLRDPANPKNCVFLNPPSIRMVGFGQEENLLPYERRSTDGYRLLQEYFVFPEKFLFFDLNGLELLGKEGFTKEVELLLLFSRFERPERQQALELGVNEKTLRLSCTPAINLFSQTAEPILVSQTRHDYTVLPDSRYPGTIEVFAIEEVVATNPRLRQSVTLQPMHAYRHQTREQADLAFWTAMRRQNELGERKPSLMSISVVDLNGRITDPDTDVLTVRALCSNFDLPSRFTFGLGSTDFDAVGSAAASSILALKRPTQSIDPPAGSRQLWRLISLLSLNYLSLEENGREALKEIMRLHNSTGTVAAENQIGAITKLASSPHFALVGSAFGLVPARGLLIEIDLDEQQFTGGGAYLFTAVIDRFLAGYCSMNTFSQLVARTSLRRKELARWAPRAGSQALL